MIDHATRVARIVAEFREAAGRLAARLERADDRAARTRPAEGAWSAAQIAWHVAAVNGSFTRVVEAGAGAQPAAAGFVERNWRDVVAGIPSRQKAPAATEPPENVDPREAATRLRESSARLAAAIAALTPDRARMCIQSPIVGTISIYQVGEWATAHVIRHNRQAKRALGEG
jgi:uncharacterized damage-inducible protein DinB